VTRILVLNGPNFASLGRREPELYGNLTLDDIAANVASCAAALGVESRHVQSNHEGTLIDLLEEEWDAADGCVINPGGLSHTSVALADGLRMFPGVVVEVHITNVFAREGYRQNLVTAAAADAVIVGLGPAVYVSGLEAAVKMVKDRAQLGLTR